MTIVNPLTTSQLVVQSTVPTGRPEERQNDLRMEQIVRATVVEGGLDRALLDLNHQRFRVQIEQELLAGQQLELQVLSTRPKLTFKLLSIPLESRLATLFPLLAKPFDWNSLVRQIQDVSAPQPKSVKQVLKQLAALLTPVVDLSVDELSRTTEALGQLKGFDLLFAGEHGPVLAAALDRVFAFLSRRTQTYELPRRLRAIARRVRQQPELMRQVMAGEQDKMAKLLTQIERPAQPLLPQQARQLAAELKELLTARSPLLVQLQQSSDKPVRELKLLLSSLPDEEVQSSPALLGHIKDFVDKLVLATADKKAWPPELRQMVEQILGTMRPLVAERQVLSQVGQLGILSQLFGLNLEAELLRGRSRDALSSLKLALLGGRAELGARGEEAVHRIELFQICRVRLAEQNVVFVPLPLPFLEEGFLLVDRDSETEQGPQQEKTETRMSLYLKLSVLGNLRIDMLSDPTGILLRVTCEDQQRADFLQGMSEQLKDHLKTLPLRGVSFASGAESPARELFKKILPQSQHMLDARV